MTQPANPHSQPDASGAPHAAAPSEPTTGGAAPSSRTPRQRFDDEMQRRQAGGSDEETTLWTGGYSPKAMIGTWIGLAVVSVGLLVAAAMVESVPLGITLIVIAALWLLAAVYYAKLRLGVQYELTSQRFIHKTGILTRRSDRIEVIDIDDVSYQQGPFQRVFGVGRIHVTSSDRSDPELHLMGIDKVSDVAGLIDDVRRAERRRRSLHIESI